MKIRVLSLSLVLLTGASGALWAQSGNGQDDLLFLPPLASPQSPALTPVQPRAQTPTPVPTPAPALNLPDVTQVQNSHHEVADEDKPAPYQFPQRHMFEQPVTVGPDQVRHHTGYWQPGGYQGRDGSPFMHSVPGAPPRGPIQGGGGDSSVNPAAGAGVAAPQTLPVPDPAFSQGQVSGPMPNYSSHYPPMQGQGGALGLGILPHHGSAMGLEGMPGFNVNGFTQSALGGVTALGNAGGSPGAGGDPHNYHFGPGYYRSGEYGHFRFPYYSYRRPWFHPGFPGYNRDVNLPW